MAAPSVHTATPQDGQKVVDVIVLAFSSDPVVRWFYPDAHQFLTNFSAFTRGFGGEGIALGSAYYTEGFHGAALWLPPGVHSDEDALMPLIRSTIDERIQEDLFGILERLEIYHPSEPHWYLPMIGVDPAYQGQGLGSAILEHALMRCDEDHTAVYLEASNPKNVPLYERYGFEVAAKLEVGSAPPVFPMVRPAR